MSLRVLLPIFAFGFSLVPKVQAMPINSHHSTKRGAAGRMQQVKIESDGSLSDAHESEESEAIEDVELIGPEHEEEEPAPPRAGATVRSQVSQTSGFSISGKPAQAVSDTPTLPRVTRTQRKAESVLRTESHPTSVSMQTTTKRHAGGARFQKNEVTDEGEEDSVPVAKRQSNVPVARDTAAPVQIRYHSATAPAPAPLPTEEDDADDPPEALVPADDASLLPDRTSQALAVRNSKSTCKTTKDGGRIVQTMKSQSGGAFYLSCLCFGAQESQCFEGILDTGSFEVVVRSTLCKKRGCKGPMYDSNKSSTFIANGTETVYLNYGSGPVETKSAFEKVCVGNSTDALCAQTHILEATFTTIDALASGEIVGIFGVGRGNQTHLDERYISKLGIDRYSVCLATNESHDGQWVWNESAPTDKIWNEIDIFGVEHWAAKLTNMRLSGGSINGTSLPLGCKTGCGAILDSGTTFITPPQETLEDLSQYMTNNNFTCEDYEHLPDLKFNLGEKTYTLPPAAYVALVDVKEIPDWLIPKLGIKPEAHHTCMFLFIDPMQTETQVGPAMIMGMPFFRYYKTIFEYKNKKVFAAPHHKCNVGKDAQTMWQTTPMRMRFDKLLPSDQRMALGKIV